MTARGARTALAGLLVALGCGGEASRPSFLVLMADDQRWDGLGVVQGELGAGALLRELETPTLDRLATEGVRFRNAFAVSSLCSPARAAMLSGQYPHRYGINRFLHAQNSPLELPIEVDEGLEAKHLTG